MMSCWGAESSPEEIAQTVVQETTKNGDDENSFCRRLLCQLGRFHAGVCFCPLDIFRHLDTCIVLDPLHPFCGAFDHGLVPAKEASVVATALRHPVGKRMRSMGAAFCFRGLVHFHMHGARALCRLHDLGSWHWLHDPWSHPPDSGVRHCLSKSLV